MIRALKPTWSFWKQNGKNNQFNCYLKHSKMVRRLVSTYSDIPGPKPHPIFGNSLRFSKHGEYPLENYWETCEKIYRNYGPVVKFKNVYFNTDFVYIFNPEDWKVLYQNEGTFPQRPNLEMLAYYRRNRPEIYTSGGLVTESGASWRKLRNAISPLLDRNIVKCYQTKQADVATALVNFIEDKGQLVKSKNSAAICNPNYVIEDVVSLLFRYTLEAVGVVCLGLRLGCLEIGSKDNIWKKKHWNPSNIISANENFLKVLGESMYLLPWYKIFPSKRYELLAKAQDYIARIVNIEFLNLRREYSRNRDQFKSSNPILAHFFGNDEIEEKDVVLLLIEMLQGGIDATATTLSYCLYFLASDHVIQDLLYEEIKDVDLKIHNLQDLPLLKAVLKETFRLRPSAAAIGRITKKECVFSGYQVPANTLIQGPPNIACQDPSQFKDPLVFNPLRWARNAIERKKPDQTKTESVDTPNSIQNPIQVVNKSFGKKANLSPYTILPFGHGARMCPGRRLAEQEIYLAIMKLIQSFKISLRKQEDIKNCEQHNYIKQKMRMNMMPAEKIALKFVKRETT